METNTGILAERVSGRNARAQGSAFKRLLGTGLLSELATVLAAIALAFLIVALFIFAIGKSPLAAYGALLNGSLGSRNGIGETLVMVAPLLLAALGATVAFRCSIWNIGIEGQLYIGALGATLAGLYLPPLPVWIHLPAVLVAGALFGGLWAALPGFFKARWNTNEILTTIMMNYLAVRLISYLVSGPMKDPKLFIPLPQSAPLPASAHLPIILAQTRAHAGILVAVLAAAVVYVLLWKTTLGYEIKSVGANPEAARYGGISVTRSIILSMLLSGALAGLAGAGEIVGVHFYLQENFTAGYGNLGITIALLGGLHPLGVMLASGFFGGLVVGAEAMQRSVGVPTTTVYFIQGLALIFVLARKVLQGRRS